MSELIALRQVSYQRPNGQWCADKLDFMLNTGERVAITGCNGGGKSTLLLLIMGLLPVTSGEIDLFGETCSAVDNGSPSRGHNEKKFRQHRVRIGLVFQDPDDQLFCPTVIDDVCFGPLNQGFSAREARQKALCTLNQLGISELAERLSYQLSGGQKRLVALATVLVMNPEMLILDEPTNGLDDANRSLLITILQQCHLPLLLISHDAQLRAELVSKEYCLQQGKLTLVPGLNTL